MISSIKTTKSTTCLLCAGPLEQPDSHEHCIGCLGLAHAETALEDSTCEHCADLPIRVLKTRRAVARSLAGDVPAAASVPPAGPPPSTSFAPRRDDDGGSSVCSVPPPKPPVVFTKDAFRPPSTSHVAVSFGVTEEDDDNMSLSASTSWSEAEPERPSHMDIQSEFSKIMELAAKELDLSWTSPDEPAKCKLDSWFLQSGRQQAAPRRKTPFFPDVHDQVSKSWSAPQSARVHAPGMFSQVDGGEAHGYVRIPPVEENVAAHLCPASATLGADRGLPSKPCRMTAHLAEKAYSSSGEAVAALHAMAILQVFQAKILQSLDGAVDADTVRNLRAATDFALMATKLSAQAIGKSMGFLVVLHRHLWLTLAELKDNERKALLNAPITPAGLFGDAVEGIGSSSRGNVTDVVGALDAVAGSLRRGSPLPDEKAERRRSLVEGQASTRRVLLPPSVPVGDKFNYVNVVCVNANVIKIQTSSQKELFPPHSPYAETDALPEGSASLQNIQSACQSNSNTANEPLNENQFLSAGPPPTPLTLQRYGANVANTLHALTHRPLRPLSQFLDAWKAIPGVSEWILSIIEHGYSLQFRRRPPRFKGVVSSLTAPQNAPILRQEVQNLLAIGAIERVPHSELESGFYSRYFVVPKKDGGLRPILDLRPINRALRKRAFKMITVRQILAQIRPGDWFASIDLKDAYFHIQISPRHRCFLRFAFEGTSYQYSVLPFGLALAPRTFTKCMDAALSPLRASGMRIMNYLDDWLIMAQSRDLLISHIKALLPHLESLGLQINAQKSKLVPSQSISYLGVLLDSTSMRAHLSQQRVETLTLYLRRFRPGRVVLLREFQRLLGLMASAAPVCHLGLLQMRPLQMWLKDRVPPNMWASTCMRVHVTHSCVNTLKPWRDPTLYSIGAPLGQIASRLVVTTDASTSGWGAVCQGTPASGTWSDLMRDWHINRLELRAVMLALRAFQPQLERQHVLVRTDNTTVVSYINHQGGIHSKALFEQAASLLQWADRHLLSIRAAHIPGALNKGADMLSRNGLPHGEWRLHPDSVQLIWDQFGRASIDLFATSENTHCPLFFSLTDAPLQGEALTSRWPKVSLYAFPPIKLIPLVLCKIREEGATVILVAPDWPNQPWYPDLREMLISPPWQIPLRRDLLSQVEGSVWHPSPELWNLHAWKVRGS
nr:uncharacterized protein LOC129429202 [Misgurnus anguillicaudatus]